MLAGKEEHMVDNKTLHKRMRQEFARQGAKARNKALTPAERSRLARRAANARWAKRGTK